MFKIIDVLLAILVIVFAMVITVGIILLALNHLSRIIVFRFSFSPISSVSIMTDVMDTNNPDILVNYYTHLDNLDTYVEEVTVDNTIYHSKIEFYPFSERDKTDSTYYEQNREKMNMKGFRVLDTGGVIELWDTLPLQIAKPAMNGLVTSLYSSALEKDYKLSIMDNLYTQINVYYDPVLSTGQIQFYPSSEFDHKSSEFDHKTGILSIEFFPASSQETLSSSIVTDKLMLYNYFVMYSIFNPIFADPFTVTKSKMIYEFSPTGLTIADYMLYGTFIIETSTFVNYPSILNTSTTTFITQAPYTPSKFENPFYYKIELNTTVSDGSYANPVVIVKPYYIISYTDSRSIGGFSSYVTIPHFYSTFKCSDPFGWDKNCLQVPNNMIVRVVFST